MRIITPLIAGLLSACALPATDPVTGPSETRVATAEAFNLTETSDLLEFGYGYPAEAAEISALAAWLDADLAQRREEALRTAHEDKEARGAEAPFFAHFYKKIWTVAGDTPRFLSLEAQPAFYTGGAHPNRLFEARLWDREADRALPLAEWFVAPRAAFASLTRDYCAGLDRLRLERRGGEVMEPGSWQTDCPPLAEQVVVPADRDGDRSFDTLFVKLPPYAAGAYAEGDFEVELPVTEAMRALLKPELRAAFAPQGQ